MEPVQCIEYGMDCHTTLYCMGGGQDGIKELFRWPHETYIKQVTASNAMLIQNNMMSASDYKPGLIERLRNLTNQYNWDQQGFTRLCSFDFSKIIAEDHDCNVKLVFLSKEKGIRAKQFSN